MLLAFTTTEKVNIALAIASGGVAIATGYLAFKTRGMAKETQRMAVATETEAQKVADQAEATEDQARISAAAMLAAIRPWLTKGEQRDPPVVLTLDGKDSLVVNLWVRNVGPGIALLAPDGCKISGGGSQPGTVISKPGTIGKPVLPPDGETGITFRVVGDDVTKEGFLRQPDTWGHFNVEILYADTNLEQQTRAEFHIVAGEPTGDSWLFDTLAYVAAPDDAPEELIARLRFRSLGA